MQQSVETFGIRQPSPVRESGMDLGAPRTPSSSVLRSAPVFVTPSSGGPLFSLGTVRVDETPNGPVTLNELSSIWQSALTSAGTLRTSSRTSSSQQPPSLARRRSRQASIFASHAAPAMTTHASLSAPSSFSGGAPAPVPAPAPAPASFSGGFPPNNLFTWSGQPNSPRQQPLFRFGMSVVSASDLASASSSASATTSEASAAVTTGESSATTTPTPSSSIAACADTPPSNEQPTEESARKSASSLAAGIVAEMEERHGKAGNPPIHLLPTIVELPAKKVDTLPVRVMLTVNTFGSKSVVINVESRDLFDMERERPVSYFQKSYLHQYQSAKTPCVYSMQELEECLYKVHLNLRCLKFDKFSGKIIDKVSNINIADFKGLLHGLECIEPSYNPCCICADEVLTSTPCNHALCMFCWERLPKKMCNGEYAKVCPLCRQDISNAVEAEGDY